MLNKAIDEAVRFIHSGEQRKAGIAEKLSALRKRDLSEFKSDEIPEDRFVTPAKKAELNCLIAGVDSGFVGKSLASVDFTLVRAVGVVMDFRNGRLAKTEYWPAIYSFPIPYLTNHALENDECNCSKSLLRLREEVRVAREIIEKFRPRYCFIDGSIVPQYADKPGKNSKIGSLYQTIIDDFQNLYETAEKNSCSLVACVEDSRGSRFAGIVRDELVEKAGLKIGANELDNMFDSSLLDYVLNEGERSFAFSYSKNTKEHPILTDYDEKWGSGIYAFYMKPAALDRPLRVEVVHRHTGRGIGDYCDEIASVVYALGSMHREYAYPSVLIEADLRARLKPDEIETIFNKIMDKIGKKVKLRLRRESRPF